MSNYTDGINLNNKNINGSTSIENLGLSIRSYNCLIRAGINTAEDLLMLSDDDITHIRNVGRKSAEEIRQKIAELQHVKRPAAVQRPDYMDMLNQLIGLENVKEQIRKIAAFAKMKHDLSVKGNKNFSDLFLLYNGKTISKGTSRSSLE